MANQKAKVTKSNKPLKEKKTPRVGIGAGRKMGLLRYSTENRRAANKKRNLARQEKVRDCQILKDGKRLRAGKPSRGHARQVRRGYIQPQIGFTGGQTQHRP